MSKLHEFLRAHYVKEKGEKTLTQYAIAKEKGVSGKYRIDEDEEEEFETLYYEEVIKKGARHYLVDVMLISEEGESGAILIDVDYRFARTPAEEGEEEKGEGVLTRKYSQERDVFPFIEAYMEEISRLFDLTDEMTIPVYLLEKTGGRVSEKDGLEHDGFHVMVGLAASKIHQEYLRERMVNWVSENWTHLPIVNEKGWEAVLDEGVASGEVGWLKYGSSKGDDIYVFKTTKAWEYMLIDESWVQTEISLSSEKAFLTKHYKNLSARCRTHESPFTRIEWDDELDAFRQRRERRKSKKNNNNENNNNNNNNRRGELGVNELRQISNREDLDKCVKYFLENAAIQRKEEWIEARDYVMALPTSYYEAGSYQKWSRVGWALHDLGEEMLVVFLEFSAQSETFNYASMVSDICRRWSETSKIEGGLTLNSIKYWLRQDNPAAYARVKSNTLDGALEQTLSSMSIHNVGKKQVATGSTSTDKARILYKMVGGFHICMSIKHKMWIYYAPNAHHWVEDDSGTYLRRVISNELRELYRRKSLDLMRRAENMDPNNEITKNMIIKAQKVLEMSTMMGDTAVKDNIMKEAMEIFFNPSVMTKMDTNSYLFCCNNGVVDFRQKIFRAGRPDDYLMRATSVNYIGELVTEEHFIIKAEITAYMTQLFPQLQLMMYVMVYFAGCLIGDLTLTQCLHYWEGVGNNGKSMLNVFLTKVFGDYARELSVGYFTQPRGKLGSTCPELAEIIGARYTMSSEPTEGEQIHEGPMKQLTSGADEIAVRKPYGQLIRFFPQAHVNIMANFYLPINSTVHGTWRRVRVIKFRAHGSMNPDPNDPYQFKLCENLDKKIDRWLEVFLSMLVTIAFETGGQVPMCDIVIQDSAKYQNDQDVIAEFFNEQLTFSPGDKSKSITKHDAFREFNEWHVNVYNVRSKKKGKDVWERMDLRFVPNKDGKWIGVSLKQQFNTADNDDEYTYAYNGEPDDDDDEDE